MNVLVLGSGGREHALAWKIAQSKLLSNLYIAPGNAGTGEVGENINIGVNDFESIKDFIIERKIDLLVVGPEDPLVRGIYDYLKDIRELSNLRIIGPSKAGATLEGSKDWAKRFMERHQIPTAKFKSFTSENISDAINYLDIIPAPYVLKADGLAAGKGVLIIDNKEDAIDELNKMFEGKFGDAGKTVVIEEFLSGIELSVFVLTDGKDYIILPEAKDYKRIGEGDTGLNTGGMGAISPVTFADNDFMQKIEKRIIQPTINGFEKEKIDYKGFVFFGLIKVNNDPYVIEYNVRMGDPEAQVVIPRVKNDLLDIFIKIADGRIKDIEIEISEDNAITVVMVSGGYPEAYDKNIKIQIDEPKIQSSIIFHAGTKISDSKLVTNGGRVIAISSFGKSIREALEKSYQTIKSIHFNKSYYRTDIGFDLKI
ncbi:phosphoribosylamine--glycine ligase [Bacteroidota bacterium]